MGPDPEPPTPTPPAATPPPAKQPPEPVGTQATADGYAILSPQDRHTAITLLRGYKQTLLETSARLDGLAGHHAPNAYREASRIAEALCRRLETPQERAARDRDA